jgi:two-component system, OmpR family, sensor kinase
MAVEVLASHRKARPSLSARFRELSDRAPLRTKLIAAVLALVIMALAAISVASVVVLRSYLYEQRDNQLATTFDHYASEFSDNTAPPLNEAYSAAGFGSGMIFALQEPGSQLSASNTGSTVPNMNPFTGAQSLPELPSGAWASANNTSFMTTPAQSGGDAWRLVGQAVTLTDSSTGDQQTAILLVAVDLGPVGSEVQRLIAVEIIVGAAIVLVLAIVGAGVVRSNLRPLDDIEMIAGEIAKGHLDHRIPERDPRTEIGSLGRSLNIMLTQIENAFVAQEESEQAAHASEERMRRFTADAAHELRTPLTTIRGFAAHYRQRGGAKNQSSRTDAWLPASAIGGSSGAGGAGGAGGAEGLSPEELDRLMSRIESEANRMGVLVEDLLTLARLDQQRPITKSPVDLLTLAADAVQDARIVSPERSIDLIVAPGTAFLVDGDEPRLRQVLANLVNNAITHTPAGTPVRVKIARGILDADRVTGTGGAVGADGALVAGSGAGGTTRAPGLAEQRSWGYEADMPGAGGRIVPAVVLDVADDGPGMTAEQAQRVFERFYRADAARNRASGGTGLGLAIVAGLVSAHGGTVSVHTAPGQGADFRVRLPLSPDALVADEPDADSDSADDLPA